MIKTTIINNNKKFNVNNRRIQNIAKKVLAAEKIDNTALTIMLCDDAFMRKENKKYFNKNCFTDVISFPSREDDYLGDILISTDRAFAQAPKFNNDFQSEFILYIIHGILHLLGYDDIKEKNAKVMRKKEAEYLKLTNKYNKDEVIV